MVYGSRLVVPGWGWRLSMGLGFRVWGLGFRGSDLVKTRLMVAQLYWTYTGCEGVGDA